MKRMFAASVMILAATGSLVAVVAQRQPGLAVLRVDLPDGAKWTLGDGGIGRPFKARLLLVNHGKDPVTIWDYQNSEGAQCPGVILTDEKAKKPFCGRRLFSDWRACQASSPFRRPR